MTVIKIAQTKFRAPANALFQAGGSYSYGQLVVNASDGLLYYAKSNLGPQSSWVAGNWQLVDTGSGGSGGGSSIVPVVVPAMGTAYPIDLAGSMAGVVIGTLDQPSCQLHYQGFVPDAFSEVQTALIGGTGKTVTFDPAQTILWDDGGFPPVIRRSSPAITKFTVYSYDGTALQGAHNQRTRRIIERKDGTAATQTGKARFPIPVDSRIVGVGATMDTAPSATTNIWDVRYSTGSGAATTVYTTVGKPTMAIGAHAVTASLPDVVDLLGGGYLQFDVTQASGADWILWVDVLEAN